jgi:hypothetical protein
MVESDSIVRVGWRYTVHQYSSKIAGIIENMFDFLNRIPAENRKIIDVYLNDHTSFRNVELLLRSLNPYRDIFDPALNARFRAYVQAEETRMEHNLQSVGYEIDDANTMQLVLGSGRIEQVTDMAYTWRNFFSSYGLVAVSLSVPFPCS